jgi:tetrapyrrole methylase family protein/MazG family protein/ATP diphosphatase
VQDVVKKLHEEVDEMLAEIEAGDLEKARNEIGDVLFVVANIARTLDVDPEDAVRYTNAKFMRRFKYVEAKLAERGKRPDQSDLAEMDALWEEVKAAERAGAA